MPVVYRDKETKEKFYGDHALMDKLDELLDSERAEPQAKAALKEAQAFFARIEVTADEKKDPDEVALAPFREQHDAVEAAKEKAREGEGTKRDLSDEEVVKRQQEKARLETEERQSKDAAEADKAARQSVDADVPNKVHGKGRNRALD